MELFIHLLGYALLVAVMLRMNVYRCAWVTQYNPWPKVEEFRAVSDEQAIDLCRQIMAQNFKTIVRMHLKSASGTIWDSEFGDTKWTISMQIVIEMQIIELLNLTGMSKKTELSQFEIQNALCDLIEKIRGKE